MSRPAWETAEMAWAAFVMLSFVVGVLTMLRWLYLGVQLWVK